jgi:hypothetical protein
MMKTKDTLENRLQKIWQIYITVNYLDEIAKKGGV